MGNDFDKRNIVLYNSKGEEIFRQDNVEIPSSWSNMAAGIFVSKYFYGKLNTPERETSIYQVIDRVVDTIIRWGYEDNYLNDTNEREIFKQEFRELFINQKASHNSPVWFGVGTYDKVQTSACFILSIEDNFESIRNFWSVESKIFNGGSGSGINISPLRSKRESLSGGGKSSGPISFMRAADSLASVIKSAGRVRRAAKLVVMNDNHPDITDFISCKVDAEKQLRVLQEAGLATGMDDDHLGVPYQSSNHSVSISDKFMNAVINDQEWNTYYINSPGEICETLSAKELFRVMCEAIHFCADPGFQFTDTINSWNTVVASGRINSSNPCLRKGSRILTKKGWQKIEELEDKEVELFDGFGLSLGKVWKSGNKKIIRLYTNNGRTIDLTEDHKIYTESGWVEAKYTKGLHIPHLFPHFNASSKMKIVEIEDLDLNDDVYDFSSPLTNSGLVNGILVHNCGEHLHLDNTACNLAVLKLTSFYDCSSRVFDIEGFKRAVDIMITAQDILIDRSEFPTEGIKENSMKFRPLGLGYSDLGGLLMRMGYSYDSNEGRNVAASIASLMTAQAYHRSAELAVLKGRFSEYDKNYVHMWKILDRHKEYNSKIEYDNFGITKEASNVWHRICNFSHGFRNSQVTLMAPNGTTGIALDCDTLGIEPEFSLVKYKTMAGKGYMKMINEGITDSLIGLGYTPEQVGKIKEYAIENGTMEGSLLEETHLPVFDCAIASDNGRCLTPEAHIKMLAAIQPHISSGISKTVNLPSSTTVEEIEKYVIMAWQMGIKGLTFYRDGCKVYQPLSTKKEEIESKEFCPVRKKLPVDCNSRRHRFRIAEMSGYLIVSFYEDGTIGEVFVKISKEGSTISGLMDSIAILTSICLQYGVPLQSLVDKFSRVKFEPSGFTDNPSIRIATSLVDYIFRFLGENYSSNCNPSEVIVKVSPVEENNHKPIMSGKICPTCGGLMTRTGSCYTCDCGFNTGCG